MDKLGQSRTPDLAELLRASVREGLAQVHTAIPGVVESYDPVKQTANVPIRPVGCDSHSWWLSSVESPRRLDLRRNGARSRRRVAG